MKPRLFLDANILFTAAYSPEGLSALLFELRRLDVLVLFTSEHAIEEARVNLQLKQPEALVRFDKLLRSVEMVHTPATSPVVLNIPEDDLSILAAAFSALATHLLTGDKKHFGQYFNKPEQTGGLVIQTVRHFFDERF